MTNERDGNTWNYKHMLILFFLNQNFEAAFAYVKEMYKEDPSIKKEDFEWIEHIKSEIIKSCKRIIYDAQNMHHRNGTAKRWGCGLLKLATYGVVRSCTTENMRR